MRYKTKRGRVRGNKINGRSFARQITGQHSKDRDRTREFNVIIERDEKGYYVASVPELQGCHTQAKSLDKLMERIREAIGLCLEVEKDYPANEFIGVQRVAVEV